VGLRTVSLLALLLRSDALQLEKPVLGNELLGIIIDFVFHSLEVIEVVIKPHFDIELFILLSNNQPLKVLLNTEGGLVLLLRRHDIFVVVELVELPLLLDLASSVVPLLDFLLRFHLHLVITEALQNGTGSFIHANVQLQVFNGGLEVVNCLVHHEIVIELLVVVVHLLSKGSDFFEEVPTASDVFHFLRHAFVLFPDFQIRILLFDILSRSNQKPMIPSVAMQVQRDILVRHQLRMRSQLRAE